MGMHVSGILLVWRSHVVTGMAQRVLSAYLGPHGTVRRAMRGSHVLRWRHLFRMARVAAWCSVRTGRMRSRVRIAMSVHGSARRRRHGALRRADVLHRLGVRRLESVLLRHL